MTRGNYQRKLRGCITRRHDLDSCRGGLVLEQFFGSKRDLQMSISSSNKHVHRLPLVSLILV